MVYVLRRESTGRYYVGGAQDPESRLAEHESGENLSTRHRGPWPWGHREQFGTFAEARKREAEIKRKKSARYLAGLILERRQLGT